MKKVIEVGGMQPAYTEEETKNMLREIQHNKNLVESAQKEQGVKTLTEKEKQHEYYLKWKGRQNQSRKEQQKKTHRDWYLKNREKVLAHQKELDAKTGRPHKQVESVSEFPGGGYQSPHNPGWDDHRAVFTGCGFCRFNNQVYDGGGVRRCM